MRSIKTEANYRNRIPATIIDYILFYGLFFMYVYLLGEPNEDGGYSVFGFTTLGIPLMWFIYFPVIESLGGQTLGHRIMGIRVVTKSGKAIDLGQALKRRLADMIDFQFFGLVALLVIRNSKTNQRLGDMWAGTLVVGGIKQYCQDCHEKLVLSAKEQVAGKYTCPECGAMNYLQQGSATEARSIRKQMEDVLHRLPAVFHKNQEFIVANDYLSHNEWTLALESMVEMTRKSNHLFSQEFWLKLKDIAKMVNQPHIVDFCHEQMLHTTKEFKGILEEGHTAELTKDGTFQIHKSDFPGQ